MTPLLERSVLNPKTGKYFGFPDYWAADAGAIPARPLDQSVQSPDTWEDVLAAGPP